MLKAHREYKEIGRIIPKYRILGFTLQYLKDGYWQDFMLGFPRLESAIDWMECFCSETVDRTRYRIRSEVEGYIVYT